MPRVDPADSRERHTLLILTRKTLTFPSCGRSPGPSADRAPRRPGHAANYPARFRAQFTSGIVAETTLSKQRIEKAGPEQEAAFRIQRSCTCKGPRAHPWNSPLEYDRFVRQWHRGKGWTGRVGPAIPSARPGVSYQGAAASAACESVPGARMASAHISGRLTSSGGCPLSPTGPGPSQSATPGLRGRGSLGRSLREAAGPASDRRSSGAAARFPSRAPRRGAEQIPSRPAIRLAPGNTRDLGDPGLPDRCHRRQALAAWHPGPPRSAHDLPQLVPLPCHGRSSLFRSLRADPCDAGSASRMQTFQTAGSRQRVPCFGERIVHRQQTEEIAVRENDPNVGL